jgi:hypothetical protein
MNKKYVCVPHDLERRFFYTVVFSFFVFIFLSNPFLKIPYDMWHHLLKIVSLHDDGKPFAMFPEAVEGRFLWHLFYAKLFKLTGVNDIFIWAKIIHVIQFGLSCLSIYYFSFTVFKILMPREQRIELKYLSLIASFLWFIGNGTFSVAHQQAWIMWYSVTYQGFTIPLFWYITALTLRIFYEDETNQKMFFYALLIIIGAALIGKIHSMELLYYLIHLSLLCLINYKKVLFAVKKHYFKLIILLLSLTGIIRLLIEDEIRLILLIKEKNFLDEIYETGRLVTNSLNRFRSSFSEIAILSLLAAIVFTTYYLFNKRKYLDKIINFNASLFLYILLSAILFSLIPVNNFLAGIAANVTNAGVVYRFFFASPWFIFLPMTTFIFLRPVNHRIKLHLLVGTNVLLMIILIILSKTAFTGTLFYNVKSIVDAFYKERVSIQYSTDTINKLRDIISKKNAESINKNKPNLYYIRGDLAPIVRGVFREYVYQPSAKAMYPLISFYRKNFYQEYNLIDINLPNEFAKNEEIFEYFPLEKKNIEFSKHVKFALPGKENDTVKLVISQVKQVDILIIIIGFCSIKEKQSRIEETYLVLKSNNEQHIFRVKRSGDFEEFYFRAIIDKNEIHKGIYNVGVHVKIVNSYLLKFSNHMIEIN